MGRGRPGLGLRPQPGPRPGRPNLGLEVQSRADANQRIPVSPFLRGSGSGAVAPTVTGPASGLAGTLAWPERWVAGGRRPAASRERIEDPAFQVRDPVLEGLDLGQDHRRLPGAESFTLDIGLGRRRGFDRAAVHRARVRRGQWRRDPPPRRPGGGVPVVRSGPESFDLGLGLQPALLLCEPHRLGAIPCLELLDRRRQVVPDSPLRQVEPGRDLRDRGDLS